MDDNCPATPLHVLPEENSKSPDRTTSSPESDRKSPGDSCSQDLRCAICLGKLKNKAFTDICLHEFCFQCLVQWTKVKPECPLCKQVIKSIIYNVRSNLDYDRYQIEKREPAYVVSEILHSYDFDLVPVDTRVRYRSTMTREYFGELGFLAGGRPYQVPNFVPSPNYHIPPSSDSTPPVVIHNSRDGGSDFRRRVYEEDLWVRDLSGITGRYRECTPQFYRENPAQIHRIIPWLNREINSLMDDNESYTAYILDRILSFLPQYAIKSLEFRSVVEPYFGLRTDHFIHEFYTFSRSVYDLNGFDQHASYAANPNYSMEVQDIMSSNEDSDIEVLGTFPNGNGAMAHLESKHGHFKTVNRTAASDPGEPVAGPSGINNLTHSYADEDDNDEVKVIDYIKPNPLVVTLSSGDEGPSYSGHPMGESMEKYESNDRKSDNPPNALYHSSDSNDTSSKGSSVKSYSHKRKHRSRSKQRTGDDKPKGKECSRRRRSRSSSSSSVNSSSSEDEGSNSRRRKRSRDHSFSSGSANCYSRSCSSSYERSTTTCSDYEGSSKSKRKRISKGSTKKMRKSRYRKRHHKGHKNHGSRRNKVRSCIVVPKSEAKPESDGGSNWRNDETYQHYSGNSRVETEVLPSNRSYWSMMIGKKADGSKWMKNSLSE